jgi:hypothetical protein
VPWRGPAEPGEFPTLGYQVAAYIEANCRIPDGDRRGQPFLLTDEMLWWLIWYYRIVPETGRWFFERGGQLVRPQKWGKGPFSASQGIAEADGPVLFDGWNARGEPVGRPWPTPLIQVTAVSEDQTDNVWRVLVPMIELGDLKADIPDTGETRINLPGGGRMEPVTASARSRLGQRVTFVIQDETHSWLERNGGRLLAHNQRRNLAGMGGRFMETTNAWDPVEQSVAQRTHENPVGVYVDYPEPITGSIRNKRERRRCMRHAYGDSCRRPDDGRWEPWIDLDRIDLEVESLIAEDPAQAERFFLNRAQAGESLAFDAQRWAELARPELVVPRGSLITVGVDGARFDDAIALVATDIESGQQWPLEIIERPKNASDDYEHSIVDVDGAMIEAFDTWEVWRAYVDPQKIENLLDRWQGHWGEKRVIAWYTNRPKQIGYAVRAYRAAMTGGDLSHNGDRKLAEHIANARKMPLTAKDDDGRPLASIQKERPGSPLKIDAAMAAVLSWEARGDAIAAGATKTESREVVGY